MGGRDAHGIQKVLAHNVRGGHRVFAMATLHDVLQLGLVPGVHGVFLLAPVGVQVDLGALAGDGKVVRKLAALALGAQPALEVLAHDRLWVDAGFQLHHDDDNNSTIRGVT